MISYCNIFMLFLFIIFYYTNEDVDECLYAIPLKKECFKIPMNNVNESCCFLEMDLNKITTTACIRIANNENEFEKRIFQIKENEEKYTLENINIECFSYYFSFSIFFFLFTILFM